VGLLAAVLYRVERDEPHRRCPTCTKVVPVHDALCTRCGTELDYEPPAAPAPVTEPASVP
jgi:predicted amidophosphoribosyltransferase